jgi:hypothetical protein
MSKKKKIIVAVVVIIMLVLFFPIPIGTLEDGGSKVYSALTYKIVKWVYHNEDRSRGYRTRVYWFPDNFMDINELREMYRVDLRNN